MEGIWLRQYQQKNGLEQAGLLMAAAWLICVFGAGLGIGYWVSR